MAVLLFLLPPKVFSNWLLQCSHCSDQISFGDEKLKSNIRHANTTDLHSQLKKWQLREFEHSEREFFNKFFKQTQIGLLTNELEKISPHAVVTLPERRWTALNGTSMNTKNVQMLREMAVVMTIVGSLQEITKEHETLSKNYWQKSQSWDFALDSLKGQFKLLDGEQIKQREQLALIFHSINRVEQTLDLAQSFLVNLETRLAKMDNDLVWHSSELHGHLKGFLKYKAENFDKIDQLENRLLAEVLGAQKELQTFKNSTSLSIEALGVQSELFSKIFETFGGQVSGNFSTVEARFLNLKNYFDEQFETVFLHKLENQKDELLEQLENAKIDRNFMNLTISKFEQILEKEASKDLVERRLFAEETRKNNEIELLELHQKYEYEFIFHEKREKERFLKRKEKEELDAKRVKLEKVAREESDKKKIELKEKSDLRIQREKLQMERQMLEMKLDVEKEKLQYDLESNIERAKIEAEAKIRDKRENEEINKKELLLKFDAERQKTIAAIQEVFNLALSWIKQLYGSPDNLLMAIGTVIGLFAGIFLVREMSILLREQLNKRLGKPSLVRITSQRGYLYDLVHFVYQKITKKNFNADAFNDVVLDPALFDQLKRLADAAKTAKNRKAPLMNCMFYGPPGTGKTMSAIRFAKYSNLDYAVMSGGDVAPLEDEAVTELHKLFTWMGKSRKGVLLFIDEADAFLSSRKNLMSENLRNALTTFLYHTGTASKQFMFVLATNRPGDLDSAVLDRIDESIEFGLPDFVERTKICKMYFEKFINKIDRQKTEKDSSEPSTDSGVVGTGVGAVGALPVVDSAAGDKLINENDIEKVAQKCEGFSGREISKMFRSLQTHVFSLGLKTASREVLQSVTDMKVDEHKRSQIMQTKGYEYDHNNRKMPCKM